MSDFSIDVRFDSREANKQLVKILRKRFGGITRNYRLLKDLSEEWFRSRLYAGKYIPYDTGTLHRSGHFDSRNKTYVWEAFDKRTGYPYAPVQYTGDNNSGVPASEWKRANNAGHDGQPYWDQYGKARDWKRFLSEYATERVCEELNKKDGR